MMGPVDRDVRLQAGQKLMGDILQLVVPENIDRAVIIDWQANPSSSRMWSNSQSPILGMPV